MQVKIKSNYNGIKGYWLDVVSLNNNDIKVMAPKTVGSDDLYPTKFPIKLIDKVNSEKNLVFDLFLNLKVFYLKNHLMIKEI